MRVRPESAYRGHSHRCSCCCCGLISTLQFLESLQDARRNTCCDIYRGKSCSTSTRLSRRQSLPILEHGKCNAAFPDRFSKITPRSSADNTDVTKDHLQMQGFIGAETNVMQVVAERSACIMPLVASGKYTIALPRSYILPNWRGYPKTPTLNIEPRILSSWVYT
jgi:hypothetical protein